MTEVDRIIKSLDHNLNHAESIIVDLYSNYGIEATYFILKDCGFTIPETDKAELIWQREVERRQIAREAKKEEERRIFIDDAKSGKFLKITEIHEPINADYNIDFMLIENPALFELMKRLNCNFRVTYTADGKITFTAKSVVENPDDTTQEFLKRFNKFDYYFTLDRPYIVDGDEVIDVNVAFELKLKTFSGDINSIVSLFKSNPNAGYTYGKINNFLTTPPLVRTVDNISIDIKKSKQTWTISDQYGFEQDLVNFDEIERKIIEGSLEKLFVSNEEFQSFKKGTGTVVFHRHYFVIATYIDNKIVSFSDLYSYLTCKYALAKKNSAISFHVTRTN